MTTEPARKWDELGDYSGDDAFLFSYMNLLGVIGWLGAAYDHELEALKPLNGSEREQVRCLCNRLIKERDRWSKLLGKRIEYLRNGETPFMELRDGSAQPQPSTPPPPVET